MQRKWDEERDLLKDTKTSAFFPSVFLQKLPNNIHQNNKKLPIRHMIRELGVHYTDTFWHNFIPVIIQFCSMAHVLVYKAVDDVRLSTRNQ